MLRTPLERLLAGGDLSREEAREATLAIMTGGANPAQIAGLLIALRAKGETIDEITGFAEAMRSVSRPIDLGRSGLVDTCGTGGDGAGTFNVSTAAALVAAGAGVPIAKHGNRSVSSACGSADVLEALGVRLVSSPDELRRSLDAAGIAFLFAPAQHPAMKHAVEPRRQLGVRTVFNILGPLTNPAGARRQVMGVYAEALIEPIAQVLGRLGATHALVVHGAGGLDEISTLGPTQVAEWRAGGVRRFTITPAELGLVMALPEELSGGNAEDNAALIRAVLAGGAGPRRDIVVANAGAAIYVAGQAESIGEGVERACAAIDDGSATEALDELVRITAGGGR